MFSVAGIYDAQISRKGIYAGSGVSFPLLYQDLSVSRVLLEECRCHVQVKRSVLLWISRSGKGAFFSRYLIRRIN